MIWLFAVCRLTVKVELSFGTTFRPWPFFNTAPIPTMGTNETRRLSDRSVLYHCACGERIVVDPSVGGLCSNCDRSVSPTLLEQDLGVTVSLNEQELGHDNTLLGGISADGFSVVTGDEGTSEPTSPEKLTGRTFGHFKLVSSLGHGGMGLVYRAFDTSLKRYVAVKLLRSGIGGANSVARSSDEEVDKLLQEAISQARVAHPNIVTIYYVGKQDGNPFLAMELVNGEPLSQRMSSVEMPFDQIAPIALEITNALKYSYDLDIIHGDIKPSNVLITKTGTAKLSDFGMARSASGDTNKMIGGTPNYLAPELLIGQLPSIETDIYALGVTFFEMTFGKPPFTLTGRAIPDWIEIHETSDLVFPTPWPGRLPEIWKSVLTKMLAKEPSDRYQSYDELLIDIKSLQPGSNIEARFFPRLIGAGIDWASALSLAIVLQVGVGFAAWQSLRDQHPGVALLLQICNFLPIIAYTFLVYFWRQSIGRSLMHIRVVNQFGMRPTANAMAVRSVIRMQFPWVVICFELLRTDSGTAFSVVLSLIYLLSLLFLTLDIAFMAFGSKGRSIHDLVSNTRVVLDTSGQT
jgi:serine/threonine protein kinase